MIFVNHVYDQDKRERLPFICIGWAYCFFNSKNKFAWNCTRIVLKLENV